MVWQGMVWTINHTKGVYIMNTCQQLRGIKRALRKMGMHLQESKDRDGYCIFDENDRPVFGRGYTLALNDVLTFTREEYKVFREA